MTRPLRVDVGDGWYHVMSRGIEQRAIFPDESYYRQFLKLLGRMTDRYAVEVHAWVLMGNHYHILLRTPGANCSQAVQWLNVSYSVWFNRKRQRTGHVFQGRFKSVLIDGNGSWLLEASAYLHLNPVRRAGLGLGKSANRAEALGWTEPDRETIRARLRELRIYPWNSYRAYVGYASKQEWLSTEVLLGRAGGKEKYRRFVGGYVTRGLNPDEFKGLGGRLAIGGRAFVEGAKKLIGKVSKEQPDRKVLRRTASWAKIVRAVESELGEAYDEFASRHGDPGRDIVFYLARERSGLTLREIGELAGGLEYRTVGQSIQRFNERLKKDRSMRKKTSLILREL